MNHRGTSPNGLSRSVLAIGIAALVAGILDISYAFTYWHLRGVAAIRVLQGVAAGLYGKSSFQRGMSTAMQGLALHFFIALSVATTFFLLRSQIAWVRRHPFVSGALYGSGVYFFMYFAVLPLSNATVRYTPVTIALNLAVHVLLIGIPIAVVQQRLAPVAVA